MALITQSDSAALISPSRGVFAAATLAELKTFTIPLANQTVEVDGSVSRGDGLAGTYYWNTTDSRADNGTTIIASNAGGVGRWNLVAATALDSTFTPAGAGAVARPVQSKERDVVALSEYDTSGHYDAAAAALVDNELTYAFKGTATNEQTIGSRIYLNLNVKGLKRSFGAVGDGVADDTTPVTRAFASGKTIEIEEGTFLYSSGGSILNGPHVRGYGMLSVLKYTGAGVALQAVGALDNWKTVCSDFKLTTTTGTHGIRLKDLGDFTIEGVFVTGFSTAGVHLTGTAVTGLCICVRLFKNWIMANTGDGILTDSVNAMHQAVIHGNRIQGNSGIGMNLTAGGFGWSVLGNDIEGNGGATEVDINGGSFSGFDFGGNYLESSSAKAGGTLRVANTQPQFGIDIHGNSFLADVAITNAITLGVSAFVTGVNVKANTFAGSYTNAINAGAVIGGDFGPNRLAGSINHAIVSSFSTGIKIFNGNQRFVVTYSASMTIDVTKGEEFDITATDGNAFTINAPTNPWDGAVIIVTLRNTSGGALGAATWNAVFKMSAWTNPANGFSRSITFKYNAANWVQIAQTGVDVPN